MNIDGNNYFCEWCCQEFKKEVKKFVSSSELSKGKSNGSAHCVCPYCYRFVSQKKQ